MRSNDGQAWLLIPNYDAESRVDFCSVSGLPKRDGDAGVFRPVTHGVIEFEGYFDIGQYAIEQAALMLGWISPEVAAEKDARISALEEEIDTARKDAYKHAAKAVQAAAARAARSDG